MVWGLEVLGILIDKKVVSFYLILAILLIIYNFLCLYEYFNL